MNNKEKLAKFKEILIAINGDFEKIQDKILEHMGADPGHDIGDSDNALDMVWYAMGENKYELDYKEELRGAIAAAIGIGDIPGMLEFNEIMDYIKHWPYKNYNKIEQYEQTNSHRIK